MLVVLTICATSTTFPWGSTGHRIINLKAAMQLPAAMASWKADSLFFAAHASDPDNRKKSSDTSLFAEYQRHFIDIDWYPNYQSLPHDIAAVIALYGRSTVHTEGTNPWITVILLDSLTARFRRGDNARAETTMSDLGHYIGDAHQPLHCTENYDGTMTGNDGIHSRYETAMINAYQSSIVVYWDSARYVDSPIDYIFDYIYRSQAYVDSIMAADTYAKNASGWSGSGNPPTAYYTYLWTQVSNLTLDEIQRATVDLASLWYTAWVNAQTPAQNVDSIFASSTSGGTITPTGTLRVPDGHDTTLTFTPQPGHHVDSVRVDGNRVDSLRTYTFRNVTLNHTISVWFSINTYTITASAGANGSISPSGSAIVNYGTSKKFTFLPGTGYHVDSVVVDDVAQPPDSSYTFFNLSANHSIKITFAINHYHIAAGAGPHGSITPSGVLDVVYGDSLAFVIRPDSGWGVDSMLADGRYAGVETTYIFHSISSNHSLAARFAEGIVSFTYRVGDRWNLLSVPVTLNDYRKSVVFPGATSAAFSYKEMYSPEDTLKNGIAYWVKFAGLQTISLQGKARETDTFYVNEGWNMIGSISTTIPVSVIGSIPEGIVTSDFFEYSKGYSTSDSIRAGYGYWVKTDQVGRLILTAGAGSSTACRIKIVSMDEMPPLPPGGETMAPGVPKKFALAQNYPNPFNPTTNVRYAICDVSHVTLKVYDVLGREIATLVNEVKQPGEHSVRWDAGTQPSGVYIYKLTAGDFSEVRKMVLTK